MFNELMLASQSVQALGTLLKAANGLANYNEIVAKVSEVNEKLMGANAVALAAQEKQSALSARVKELESEVTRLRDWSAEAERYETREVAVGVFAYLSKSETGKFQSAHKLCANCFNQGTKSLLQQQKVEVGRQLSLVCHRCKANIVFSYYVEQTLPSSGRRTAGFAHCRLSLMSNDSSRGQIVRALPRLESVVGGKT